MHHVHLEQKHESFRERGWTEDDVLLAFRNCPLSMRLSAETIEAEMDFLINFLMKWVTRVLLLKGLMKKEDVCYDSLVCLWEDEFLHKFVQAFSAKKIFCFCVTEF